MYEYMRVCLCTCTCVFVWVDTGSLCVSVCVEGVDV